MKMVDLLDGYMKSYNSDSNRPTEKYAHSEFDMFQKWHDMHFQFEEHWKLAGLTPKGDINPKMYQKM